MSVSKVTKGSSRAVQAGFKSYPFVSTVFGNFAATLPASRAKSHDLPDNLARIGDDLISTLCE